MTKKQTLHRKKVNTETIPESIYLFLSWLCGAFAFLCGVLVLVIMPFYFRQGYTHIGSDKSYFLRTSCRMLYKLILPVWGVTILLGIGIRISRAKRAGSLFRNRIRFQLGDFFVLCYGVSAVISWLGSSYPKTALWGTKGWYMGMIPQLAFVALYFLISRYLAAFLAKALLVAAMVASSATFLLGYLNRFDVWPIPMENSGLPAYISTIGNINWFCGYMVSVLFLGVGLFWLDQKKNSWKRVGLILYCFLGFAVAGVQGSDSGVVASLFVFFFLYELSAGQMILMKNWLQLVVLLGVSGMFTSLVRILFPGRLTFSSSIGSRLVYSPIPLLLTAVSVIMLWMIHSSKETLQKKIGIIFRKSAIVLKFAVPGMFILFVLCILLNTLFPGSIGPLSQYSVFTFQNSWGSYRGASWKIGLQAFGEQDLFHKIIGIGPDCMADFLYQDAGRSLKALAKEAFQNKRLTNAHSECITILLNMGVAGAASYVGMIFCQIRDGLKKRQECIFGAACSLCVLAYCVNNIWSFQQSMSTTTIFAVMGLGRCILRDVERNPGKGAI